jgi:hypothetical protein
MRKGEGIKERKKGRKKQRNEGVKKKKGRELGRR